MWIAVAGLRGVRATRAPLDRVGSADGIESLGEFVRCAVRTLPRLLKLSARSMRYDNCFGNSAARLLRRSMAARWWRIASSGLPCFMSVRAR